MKYKIVRNITELYSAAPWRRLRQSEYFARISVLLGLPASGPFAVTLGSVEDFFKAGGVLAIATHYRKVVGIASLSRVVALEGVYGEFGKNASDRKHLQSAATIVRTLRTMLLEDPLFKKPGVTFSGSRGERAPRKYGS